VLPREQISVTHEAEYIVRCAVQMKDRAVTLGQLLFFSTETGDAWVLDPTGEFARCLATGGEPRSLGIVETQDRFGVEWEAAYAIEGKAMIFRDGIRERVILGYPVMEIRQAVARMESER
jgi:hypothetical protein